MKIVAINFFKMFGACVLKVLYCFFSFSFWTLKYMITSRMIASRINGTSIALKNLGSIAGVGSTLLKAIILLFISLIFYSLAGGSR
jgi:hypothetical protein